MPIFGASSDDLTKKENSETRFENNVTEARTDCDENTMDILNALFNSELHRRDPLIKSLFFGRERNIGIFSLSCKNDFLNIIKRTQFYIAT